MQKLARNRHLFGSTGPPHPGQHAAEDRSDQASECIVDDVIDLEISDAPAKLRVFRGAAAQKSGHRTGSNTVPHWFDHKRQQVPHRYIKKNVQKYFSGCSQIADVDMFQRTPQSVREHTERFDQSVVKIESSSITHKRGQLFCVDHFPAQDRKTQISQYINDKDGERRPPY